MDSIKYLKTGQVRKMKLGLKIIMENKDLYNWILKNKKTQSMRVIKVKT